MRIAVSKNSHLFSSWLYKVELVDLYLLPQKEALAVLKDSHGLILSGGGDLDPSYYGKAEEASVCDIDAERDRREWEMLQLAMKENLPLLGVCRGFQLINVFLGGTLIPDFQNQSKKIHRAESGDAIHEISIEEGTYLRKLAQKSRVLVNSRHHQGIERLAPTLIANAVAEDGVIEGFEGQSKSFLLGVEWHPERWKDPLSESIAEAFIEQTRRESALLKQR